MDAWTRVWRGKTQTNFARIYLIISVLKLNAIENFKTLFLKNSNLNFLRRNFTNRNSSLRLNNSFN